MASTFPTGRWDNRQATFYPRRRWQGLAPLRAVLLFAFFGERVVLCDIEGRGWTIPSGHIQPGETPEQAIRREAHEEAGITVDKVLPIGVYALTEPDGSRWYSGVFIGEVTHFDPIPTDSESHGVLLIPPEDVQDVYHLWNPLVAEVFAYALVQYRQRFRPGVPLREVYQQFARAEPVDREINSQLE